jgi:hypothetical protein
VKFLLFVTEAEERLNRKAAERRELEELYIRTK